MVCGGVEKELITILNRFNPQEYDLSVLLFYSQDKEIEKKIPNYVKIINLQLDKNYYCGSLKTVIQERIRKGEIIEAVKIARNRIVKSIATPVSISLDKINALEELYDFATICILHLF